MLTTSKAFSSFAVPDVDAARSFYGETLGLDVRDGEMGLVSIHLADGTAVMVYPKPDHEPATFTVLNFPVEDLDTAVADLAGRGVTFQRYDAFEHESSGIVRGDGQGPDIAWFTDPAGNVLAVLDGD